MSKVYMIKWDREVDDNLLQEILKKNYSRVPIYYGDKQNCLIIGILLMRSLIGLKFESGTKVYDLIREDKVTVKEPLYIMPSAKSEHVLNLFKKGHIH